MFGITMADDNNNNNNIYLKSNIHKSSIEHVHVYKGLLLHDDMWCPSVCPIVSICVSSGDGH